MIEGVIIKQLKKNKDERGWLMEIYRNDEVSLSPAMGYISLTRPGVTRGPHEHSRQADAFAFLGPGNFILHLWDRRQDSPTKGEHLELEVGENNPSLVIIPPGIVHGYKCVGDQAGYVINLPDTLYKGEGKAGEIDEIRWEEEGDSPYKIS